MKKHEVVEAWIRKRIDEGGIAPGEKLPSESQLCEQFSVSRNAVRQAIHTLLHESRVETIKGVGTFCRPRKPPIPVSTSIGLVEFFISSYIYPEIIRGCYNTLSRRGFDLVVNQSEYNLDQEKAILMDLRKKKVGGIIIAPIYGAGDRSNALLLEEIQSEGIAVVLCDDYFPGRSFSSVVLDDHAGGEEAASHLWRKGHRKIGIFYQKDFLVKATRMRGVVDFLGKQGAPVPGCLDRRLQRAGPGQRRPGGGREVPERSEGASHRVRVRKRRGCASPHRGRRKEGHPGA